MHFTERIKKRLSELGEVPPIETHPHHKCHAASALYPAPFDEALVITIDGQGEYDSTVVWRGTKRGLERIRTYEFPNSLGQFFSVITKYLGYQPNNGEGKVMGLAPYGSENTEIESALRSIITTGVEYDVRDLVRGPWSVGVERLEDVLGHPAHDGGREYDEWYQDLAFITQKLLEETVTSIVDDYIEQVPTNNVALAGGVALNCKMNKQVNELPSVDELFVQPVANDAGVSLGAGMLNTGARRTATMTEVYLGPEYSTNEIESLLRKNKIEYSTPEDLEREVAKEIADGQLVGWFQGRMELGPRALGNRSILADPRTIESRDRVNEYVKHREQWRPFAPSILEEHADEYLESAEPAPFMIKTFNVKKEKKSEIPAVVHHGDDTTRPQTVNKEQNTRYYRLISEFEELTDVPLVLNTSYNDHGEPIVNTPVEALKDFYGMGLDLLVLGDHLVRK